VAEKVPSEPPLLDAFVSRTKKIFVKALGVPVPPEPLITRWGTWIEATLYYCYHVYVVKNIVNSVKTEDAKTIAAAQQQFSCSDMEGQMDFIKTNFSSLTEGIKCL
jgi:hypothetical protein